MNRARLAVVGAKLRSEMMTCQEFLEGYSEYLDERLGLEEARRWRDHIVACSSCARYDSVMRRGLELVRELPVTEPSSDFHMGLRYRLRRVDVPETAASDGRSSVAGAGVPLAIAAVIAALAWSPLLRPVLTAENASVARPAGSALQPPNPSAEVASTAQPDDETSASAAMAAEAGAGRSGEVASTLPAGQWPPREAYAAPVSEPRIAAGPAVAPVWISTAPARPQVATGGVLSGHGDPMTSLAAVTAAAEMDEWPVAPVRSLSRRSLWPEPERVVPTLWEGPTPLEIWRRSTSNWSIRSNPAERPLLLESRGGRERGSPRFP